MRTGPNVISDGLIFAVDPASTRVPYMQDIVNDSAVTTVGTPTTSSLAIKTVSFDGDGEQYHYGTSNVVRGLDDITIMGWAQQSTTSNPHQTLFCTSTDYQYGLKLMSRYHGQWSAWIGSGSVANTLVGSGNDITGDTSFYLIGCTRNAQTGDIVLYQNGTQVASNTSITIKGTMTENGNTSYGSDYHSNGYRHVGKLGQVWVWNRVLTADEMSTMYNVTKTRYRG